MAETVANVVTNIAEVSRSLRAVLGARLSIATAKAVEELPAIGKTAEQLAADGLKYSAESSSADDALFQSYLRRKEAAGGRVLSRDAWQSKLDALRTNKLTGDGYRDQVASDLGIKPGEGGWVTEYNPKELDVNRRFDLANPTTSEAIEVKSGSTPIQEGLTQPS